jgi:hypothetical protein
MIFSWCKMFHEYDTSCACVAIIPWTNLVTFQDFSFDEPCHGWLFSLEILPYFNLILVRKCVLGGTAGTTSTAASTRISSGRLVRYTCSSPTSYISLCEPALSRFFLSAIYLVLFFSCKKKKNVQSLVKQGFSTTHISLLTCKSVTGNAITEGYHTFEASVMMTQDLFIWVFHRKNKIGFMAKSGQPEGSFDL